MRLPTTFLCAALCVSALAAQPQLVSPLGGSGGQTPMGSGCAPAPRLNKQRPKLTRAEKLARAFRGPQVQGHKLSKAITRVRNELTWHKALDAAQNHARRENRPIVWFQVLGDLHGFT